MAELKLPYIPDKKLYAAVMGACSYIRDTGWFNKAVSYYADKYDVLEEDVAKYVRIAQGNGQKKANERKPKREYHWFVVEYSLGNERNGADCFSPTEARYAIRKGTSAKTVMRRMSANDDVMSEYAPCHWFGRVRECRSKDEAYAVILRWEQEGK